ncbi:MAG: rhamnogalacturonan acetylesterase [Lachnospiraceae bacterium]|nr:rhamnogalacturonan acetylesterase [Lachnospiraceae bacterium]
MRTIYWAGDSTVKTNLFVTFPQTGIGQAFDRYVKPDVVIYNHAENGRSTKSFLAEGRLPAIDENIQKGDFLFIQFGHNDEKLEDPLRGTHPDGDFIDNLGIFVETAKKHGAYPVLITPLERRLFATDGTLKTPSAHEPYVKAIFEAGKRFETPVIDLWSISRAFLAKEGDAETIQYFMHTVPGEYSRAPEGQVDNTHLKYAGAMTFAGMIARELIRMGGVYAELIAEPEALNEAVKIEING